MSFLFMSTIIGMLGSLRQIRRNRVRDRIKRFWKIDFMIYSWILLFLVLQWQKGDNMPQTWVYYFCLFHHSPSLDLCGSDRILREQRHKLLPQLKWFIVKYNRCPTLTSSKTWIHFLRHLSFCSTLKTLNNSHHKYLLRLSSTSTHLKSWLFSVKRCSSRWDSRIRNASWTM